MHEKQPEVDFKMKKMGESNWWHKDMFKRSGPESDSPAQSYLSALPSAYPLHMWSHPLFQNFMQTAMPQYPMHTREQEIGGRQGGTQTCPLDKSESSELPGPSAEAGCHSSHSASSEPHHEDSSSGAARVPYNYPGGFVFPPYPGQLDPLMLWMHHMQRQVAYLYSTSGCRNGYQIPPPIPSNGASQRDYIRIPSGIPQKYSRLWETQSTENVQLWSTVTQLSATVARAEAEIFCQRGKISKLEDNLQHMKIRQDAMSEALKGKTVFPQTKRVRRKRTATAPIAILGLPASQLFPEKAQVKKARGLISDGNVLKVSHPELEGRSEEIQLDSSLECTNRSLQGVMGDCTSLTKGLGRKETTISAPSNDKVEREHRDNENDCIGDMVAREGSQNSCVRGSTSAEMAKGTFSSQNIEIKWECGNGSTYDIITHREGAVSDGRKEEACLTESKAMQAMCSGDCSTDSEMMEMGEPCTVENRVLQAASTRCRMKDESNDMVRGDNWSEGIEEGSMEEGLLRASGVLERSNASDSRNERHRAGESLKIMTSEKQCDEVKNRVTPQDLIVANISDYLVVYPETLVSNESLM